VSTIRSPLQSIAPVPAGSLADPSPDPVPLSILSFECSLATAPIDDLEGAVGSLSRDKVESEFDRSPTTREAALLSTCHRLELYLVVATPEAASPWERLLPGSRDLWIRREGRDVVHHLFRVSAGRESLATGETDVIRQVERAARSGWSRHSRPVLRGAFEDAVRAAHEIARGHAAPRSVASAGAEFLRASLGPDRPRVLVIGSGTVGREVTRELSSFARVTMLYHTRPPDPEFVLATGAEARPLYELADELREASTIVTAAKFGHRGVHAYDLPRDRPLLLVDLGMPRNVDPSVRTLPNVRLVDLAELHALSRAHRQREARDVQVEERAHRCFEQLDAVLAAPWVDALLRAAEATRRTELEAARSFLGSLDPDQEAAIDRLTRRLVARLLVPPAERIRALPPGPVGDLERRLALELLRPRDTIP
jgi:glutamyl-tRNA reductase